MDKDVKAEKIKQFITQMEQEKTKATNDRKKFYYNKFVEQIKLQGGECLSSFEVYIDAHTKLQVLCAEKHIFEITLNNLNHKRWCPICHIFIGEKIAISAIEYLLGKLFPKVRPTWLKVDSGSYLELDGYNDELKIAIEMNGIQHYKEIKHFHRKEGDFQKRLEYDKLKIIKCKEMGVRLIIVPYIVEHNNICNFIAKELEKIGYQISNDKITTYDYTCVYKRISKEKICKGCNIPKLLESYHKDKNRKDGLNTKCKNCHNKQIREYKQKRKLLIQSS